MCVVSNTGDMWGQRLRPWKPYIHPFDQQEPFYPQSPTTDKTTTPWVIGPKGPTQADFDLLKREVEIMKEALKQAKKYDEENGEPDCEIEEKMKFLRQVAKAVGVDLDDVISPKK